MTDRISERHVKIMFPLEQDEDGYPPATTESLWAIDSAKLEHGALQYVEVVRASGHSTLRVVAYDASQMPAVRAFFEQMGCSTELSHLPSLVAIDVPPTVAFEPLRQVLATATLNSGAARRDRVFLRSRLRAAALHARKWARGWRAHGQPMR